MNYSEAIEYLYQLRLFGTKLGLENTRRLAAMEGNPQDRLRFIHVAGTNGKGSVCAMLESIYRAAGFKIGLFTSPHLVSFAERMQVNGRLIPESDVARWVKAFATHLQEFPDAEHPTFFEVVTVMALCHFAEQACDLVVWETGMGGRLDATNIVTPLASVITNVGLDHQRWLGDNLPQVAMEKAGIIKPGIPVLTATRDAEVLDVLTKTAQSRSAPLIQVRDEDLSRPPLPSLNLPLAGEHQRWNAALALAVVEQLQGALSVSPEAVRRGLETVHWPGRMQRISLRPGQTILLDGAHNPPGFAALQGALEEGFPGRSPALLMGMLEDKDWSAMCRTLAPGARAVHLVPVQSMRSISPQALVPVCQAAHPGIPVQAHPSLDAAWSAIEAEPLIVVCGSLYLVGEVMEFLGISPQRERDEKALNEWGIRSEPRD